MIYSERGFMNYSVAFNKGYDSTYMFLPLQKFYNGLTVKSQNPSVNSNYLDKDTLNLLKQSDTDKNNILTLDELKNINNKNEFMLNLEKAMVHFSSNFDKDYSDNIFESDME